MVIIDKRQVKKYILPIYNETTNKWAVITKNDIYEYTEGDIIKVYSAFSHTYLYYPYSYVDSSGKRQTEYCIYFDKLLATIIKYYKTFSIEDFKDHYSQQEIEFINKVLDKYKTFQ